MFIIDQGKTVKPSVLVPANRVHKRLEENCNAIKIEECPRAAELVPANASPHKRCPCSSSSGPSQNLEERTVGSIRILGSSQNREGNKKCRVHPKISNNREGNRFADSSQNKTVLNLRARDLIYTPLNQ